MVKNNISIVIMQVILSFFWMGFMFLINLSESLESFFYGNLPVRIAIVALVVLVFFLMGKLLKKNISFSEVLFSGILSVGIGSLFFLIAYLGEGKHLLDGAVGTSLWRFPLDFYLLPQMFVIHLMGISKTWLSYLIAIVLGSGTSVISLFFSYLRYKKFKQNRKRRESGKYV